MNSLKLISWNIAGRTNNNEAQASAIFNRKPDIVCLQEVRINALSAFGVLFRNHGFSYIESVSKAIKLNRIKGNLIASKLPITLIQDSNFSPPHPESILLANIHTKWGDIKLLNAHVPNGSSYGWTKIKTFESLYTLLATKNNTLRILCGDFNSPAHESRSGMVSGFRKASKRWELGELSVITGLAKFNLPDVFRLLHGYEKEDYSYVTYRKGKIISKRRFDHVFSSLELNPVTCIYLHKFRESKLSDHSPIEVVFSP